MSLFPESPAGANSFYTYNGWALPNQSNPIILAWNPYYAAIPSNYIITINESTVVLPSSSSGYIVPSPIVGAVYNIYWKAINCLGSGPFVLNFTVKESTVTYYSINIQFEITDMCAWLHFGVHLHVFLSRYQ